MAIQGPKQVANQQISALHADSTVRALVVHAVDASGAYVSPGAGSTQVSIKEILTSSGASVMDSTNNAIGVTIRAGSAAGTEYTDGDVDATISGGALLVDNSSNTLRPGTLARGLPVNIVAGSVASTQVAVSSVAGVVNVQQNSTAWQVQVGIPDQGAFTTNATLQVPIGAVVGAGDVVAGKVGALAMSSVRALWVFPVDSSGGKMADSTLRAIRITSVDAASTGPIAISSIAGVSIVRPEAGSTWSVRPLQSSAADLQMTATPAAGSTWAVRPLQSSQADLRVTVYQSSAAELLATVSPSAGSTWAVRPLQSSAADLQVTVTQVGGSTWKTALYSPTLGLIDASTVTQSTGIVNGLNVREVMPSGRESTTVVITSTHSTAVYQLISSVAGLRRLVSAYFVGSTHTNPSTLVFMSSLTIDRWAVNFGSGSSGITGANLAVTAPDWLFGTDQQNALNVRVEGGGSSVTSTVVVRISLKWFTEP